MVDFWTHLDSSAKDAIGSRCLAWIFFQDLHISVLVLASTRADMGLLYLLSQEVVLKVQNVQSWSPGS